MHSTPKPRLSGTQKNPEQGQQSHPAVLEVGPTVPLPNDGNADRVHRDSEAANGCSHNPSNLTGTLLLGHASNPIVTAASTDHSGRPAELNNRDEEMLELDRNTFHALLPPAAVAPKPDTACIADSGNNGKDQHVDPSSSTVIAVRNAQITVTVLARGPASPILLHEEAIQKQHDAIPTSANRMANGVVADATASSDRLLSEAYTGPSTELSSASIADVNCFISLGKSRWDASLSLVDYFRQSPDALEHLEMTVENTRAEDRANGILEDNAELRSAQGLIDYIRGPPALLDDSAPLHTSDHWSCQGTGGPPPYIPPRPPQEDLSSSIILNTTATGTAGTSLPAHCAKPNPIQTFISWVKRAWQAGFDGRLAGRSLLETISF